MKFFLKLLLGIIVTVVLIVGGVFLFFKLTYNINLITSYKLLKQASVETNVEKVVTNPFTTQDTLSLQAKLNQNGNTFLKGDESNGFTFDTSVVNTPLTENISLKDKECGAILNILLNSSTTDKPGITINKTKIDLNLIQIKFSNLEEKSVKFNAIVKLSLKDLKASLNKGIFRFINKKLPNDIYISSTIKLEKGLTPFTYTKTSETITINNLNDTDSKKALTDLGKFIQFGSVEDLNTMIAGSFSDALIGTVDTQGFAKSFTSLGFTDYNFTNTAEEINFVIVK